MKQLSRKAQMALKSNKDNYSGPLKFHSTVQLNGRCYWLYQNTEYDCPFYYVSLGSANELVGIIRYVEYSNTLQVSSLDYRVIAYCQGNVIAAIGDLDHYLSSGITNRWILT